MSRTIQELEAILEKKEASLKNLNNRQEHVNDKFMQLNNPSNSNALFKKIELENAVEKTIKLCKKDPTPENRNKLTVAKQNLTNFKQSLNAETQDYLTLSRQSAAMANQAQGLHDEIATLKEAIKENDPKIAEGIDELPSFKFAKLPPSAEKTLKDAFRDLLKQSPKAGIDGGPAIESKGPTNKGP
ncbi:MAG: hypothetical protein CK424_05640 [Legionella sp.]|nr:MAG: hypothetical protein CK424_05640 [Legionella sp.]